jgi:hypothetical protein
MLFISSCYLIRHFVSYDSKIQQILFTDNNFFFLTTSSLPFSGSGYGYDSVDFKERFVGCGVWKDEKSMCFTKALRLEQESG